MPRECAAERSQHQPFSAAEAGPADLAPEDCELVAKDQDLDIAVASIGSASHEHEGDQPAQEQGEGRRAKSTGGASFPGEGPILQRPCSPA